MFNGVFNSFGSYTSEAADKFFENIKGDYYRDDKSFVTTLRVLLKDRCEGFNFVYDSKLYNTIVDSLQDCCCNTTIQNAIVIKNVRRDCEEDILTDALTSIRDYTLIKDAYAMFKRYDLDVYAYKNEKNNTAVIIVKDLNLKVFHGVQILIPRLIPNLFKDKPLTDKEKLLLLSTSKTTINYYCEALSNLEVTKELDEFSIWFHILEFTRNSYHRRISVAKSVMENMKMEYERFYERYDRALKEYQTASISYQALVDARDNQKEDVELVEYFRSHKNIEVVGTENGKITFIVSGFIDQFDPDIYASKRRAGTNDLSERFRDYLPDEFADKTNRQLFIDGIFSDMPCFRIKNVAAYTLDIAGTSYGLRGYRYPVKYKSYIPNPHIDYHACLGDYRRFIDGCLKRGDIIMAIEQCCSSSRSINIGEWDITVAPWLQKVMSSREECVVLPDGKEVTSVEALKWLKEKK